MRGELVRGSPVNTGDRKRGHYLGTEIDERWWRRYSKEGFLARGIGEYWVDGGSLFFLRYLTANPIVIPLHDVVEVKVGRWHSGRWAVGKPIVKLVWMKEAVRLSSGFILSADRSETEKLVAELRLQGK
ncbi:MAG: hypothetical protein QME77_11050 [bacterium]|nr:hypothetical protein [bacterium]